MTRKEIKKIILEKAEPENAVFQGKIIKSKYKNHGVRVSKLRKIAKKIIEEDEEYELPENPIYEELLTYGFTLAYDPDPLIKKRERILEYLDLIDSWSLCDSFSSSFNISENEREPVFEFLKELSQSVNPFYERFSLVMFLSHYLKFDINGEKLHRPKHIDLDSFNDFDGLYIKRILEILKNDYTAYESYIAAGWLGAEAFLFYPNAVIKLLQENELNENVRKSLIKKITESKIPDKKVKEYIKRLK